MPSSSDHHHHLRRVVLPSGKTIEVVYFEDAGTPPAAPAAPAAPMHVCPECASELVHPVRWEESGPEHWDVLLRCPGCEWSDTGVHGQAAVDDFDEHLDRGTAALIGCLKQVTNANMQEGIERFVAALEADLIVPEDF